MSKVQRYSACVCSGWSTLEGGSFYVTAYVFDRASRNGVIATHEANLGRRADPDVVSDTRAELLRVAEADAAKREAEWQAA